MRLVDTKPGTVLSTASTVDAKPPVKRRMNPNSLANLRPKPWPKGVSGNPAGAPSVGPRIRPALMKFLDWQMDRFDALSPDDFKNMTVADALACTMLKRGAQDDQAGDKVREFVAGHVDGSEKAKDGVQVNVLIRQVIGVDDTIPLG